MFKSNFTGLKARCLAHSNGLESKYSRVYVDQSPSINVNLNSFGWPKSDIQLLLESSDSIMQQNILNRLQMMKEQQNSQFEKLPDALKLRILKPSFVQSPSEVAKFAEYCKQFEPELARVLGVEYAKEVIAENAPEEASVSTDDGSLSFKE